MDEGARRAVAREGWPGAGRRGTRGRMAVVATVLVATLVVATVVGSTAATAAGAQAGAARTVEDAKLEAPLDLEAGPGQAVAGRSDAPAGTTLTVRLHAPGDGDDFLRSVTTRVDDAGRFRAVVDLSEVAPGTALRVVVHRNGTNLTGTTTEVGPCADACGVATPATPSAVVATDGDELTLQDVAGQAIRGETNLPPGSRVAVVLTSRDNAQPFVKQTVTRVDENGTFRAVFDLSGIEGTVPVRATVNHNGTELTTERGTVECATGCPEGSADGDSADVFADANVGVVQVPNGSVAAIEVSLGNAESATLALGSPEAAYAVEMTVTDGSGDGTVVVLFDTASAAGNGSLARAEDAGDTVRVEDERGTFAATDYRLTLHPPDNRSREVAAGLLVVTQDGGATPLLTATPDTGPGSLGAGAALAAGALLAVAGVGLLLGVVDLGAVLGR